jgi:hypothetical protein
MTYDPYESYQSIIITSTTLYITCIAGCQYNFIHITRILFNFANDIAGCQYNFIHITRILFNFANDMTSQGASIISFISLEFCLILLMTLGPKSGSQMGVSQIEVQIGVPNRGPKSGS